MSDDLEGPIRIFYSFPQYRGQQLVHPLPMIIPGPMLKDRPRPVVLIYQHIGYLEGRHYYRFVGGQSV